MCPRVYRSVGCIHSHLRLPGIEQVGAFSTHQVWPVSAFYNVLDLAAINAWILYRSCTGHDIPRRDFILQLAEELRAEWMMSKQTAEPQPPLALAETQEPKRKTCELKTHCIKNRTPFHCHKCMKAICGNCTANAERLCFKCTA